MNELLRQFPSLGMGKATVNSAIKCIKRFRKEVLTKEIPTDLVALFDILEIKNAEEKYRWSPSLWEGEFLQDSFLEAWDFDPNIIKKAQTNLSEVLQNIGLALKHYFAWQAISDFLRMKRILHPELLLESIDDLRCTIFLAKGQFFKQALQVLRNYCEICVGMLYFELEKEAFTEWYEDRNYYHVPDI